MSKLALDPVNVLTSATAPTLPTLVAGDLYYNTTTGLMSYNGTFWSSAGLAPVVTNAQTASYTLVATDTSKLIEMLVASANTVTIPPNSSVAFAIGTQITILQTGAGQTTIVAGSGVTANATPTLKLRAQWSATTLIKRATDTWVVIGDMSS